MPAPALRVLVLDQARGVWGAQRYLLRLAPLLRERGVELTLAGSPTLELHAAWRDSGLPAISFAAPIDRSIRGSSGPTLPAAVREGRNTLVVARRIAHLVRRGGYDALWANGHWTHLDTSIAGRIARRPVVLHLHEESLPGLGSTLRAGAVMMATQAVAVSRAVAAGLPRVAKQRVRVIPNGVDTQAMSLNSKDAARLRAELGIGERDVMVLAATRLDPTKRIEDLIACQRLVDDERVHLVIAGSTSGHPDYERRVRAEASASHEKVTFCGSRDDMAALYGASDVVVHSGVVEGMPLTVIEAQACGRPVVAYDVAGVAEAVRDGVTGVLVEPLDVTGLAHGIRGLVDDPKRRKMMGAAAREHVVAHHRIELQAELNADVLSEICGRGA